eukprot:4638834-Pyramimonas_sp.AAC.1
MMMRRRLIMIMVVVMGNCFLCACVRMTARVLHPHDRNLECQVRARGQDALARLQELLLAPEGDDDEHLHAPCGQEAAR